MPVAWCAYLWCVC